MQLSQPPIYTAVTNPDGSLNPVWIQWFSLVQTIINQSTGQSTTTPPVAGTGATFTGHYGGTTNALGDPTQWLSIGSYKVPGY